MVFTDDAAVMYPAVVKLPSIVTKLFERLIKSLSVSIPIVFPLSLKSIVPIKPDPFTCKV